jgi:hypothetical protein
MTYKKFFMWFFVFLTLLSIYALFNHSPIPLLFSYIIHPFICSLGLTIAGLIGREYMVGRIILTAVIGSFSIFILIITTMIVIEGLVVVYWAAGIFLPLFNSLLFFGFILSGLAHVNKILTGMDELLLQKRLLITFCIIWILVSSYLIISGFLKGLPIATHVVILLGFLLVLYLACGRNDVFGFIKKDSESAKVKKEVSK